MKPEYYAAMLRGSSNDPHGLSAMAADAWPIWIWLDQQEPKRIAFAAGWDGKGHHWYRSPLLGEQLQHDVVYVSPIGGDELVDYRWRDEVIRRADMGAWVQRLLDTEVDLVVLGTPPAVEHRWVVKFPDVFEPVAFGERQRVVAFLFNRERLADLGRGRKRALRGCASCTASRGGSRSRLPRRVLFVTVVPIGNSAPSAFADLS